MTSREGLAVSPASPEHSDRADHAAKPDASTSSAATDVDRIAADATLVGESRRRIRRKMVGKDRRSGLLTGGSFLVVVASWNLVAPPASAPVGMFAGCVAAFIVAGCVEFEIGPGCALPTTPVQVVMLFVLPPQLVPVAVVSGLAGAALVARLREPERKERATVLAGSGWQVVGPAAVFAFAHVSGPSLSDWPVYVLALAAQFSLDAATSWVRNCYGLGVEPRQLAAALQFTFLCDLTLAPVGFAAALAVPHSAGALLLLLPPTALLAVLQWDRRKQIDKTVALAVAFNDTSDLARRDALTGVSNRLAWEEATARYQDADAPVGVVLADVDGLKVANDTYGHAMGDRLLVAVAAAIANAVPVPSGATAFRIGGDEFAILLPFASLASTLAVASSLRAAIQTTPNLDGTVPVSASIGVGFASSGRTLGKAIATADRGVNNDKTSRGAGRRDRHILAPKELL
jgi:diguanylate cyclase (GGDEF)-like protein